MIVSDGDKKPHLQMRGALSGGEENEKIYIFHKWFTSNVSLLVLYIGIRMDICKIYFINYEKSL